MRLNHPAPSLASLLTKAHPRAPLPKLTTVSNLFASFIKAATCNYSTGFYTYTRDVSVHSNVVQVILFRLNFSWILLGNVFACKQIFLSKLGVVVKVDFGIKTHDYRKYDNRSPWVSYANPGS